MLKSFTKAIQRWAALEPGCSIQGSRCTTAAGPHLWQAFQDHVCQAFQAAITPAAASHLENQGYVVIDNLFPAAMADALRAEVVGLFKVRQNITHLVEKSHIHEAELTFDPGIQQAAPLCSHLNQDRTLATMLSLFLPVRLDAQAIKLQYNAGQGACFPMHLDTDAMIDGRTITAIFYLNPRWRPEYGGQLRVYPWPRPPVDVEPSHNRLVLFSSAHLLHRVMPTHLPTHDTGTAPEDSNRCCFTIWLSQERGRRRSAAPPPSLSTLQPADPTDRQACTRFLMLPYVRPHAMKLAYAEEWEESLRQSHSPGPELTSLLEQHRAEVAIIERALSKYTGLIKELAVNQELAHQATSLVKWL